MTTSDQAAYGSGAVNIGIENPVVVPVLQDIALQYSASK
jgi:hypothetical protein